MTDTNNPKFAAKAGEAAAEALISNGSLIHRASIGLCGALYDRLVEMTQQNGVLFAQAMAEIAVARTPADQAALYSRFQSQAVQRFSLQAVEIAKLAAGQISGYAAPFDEEEGSGVLFGKAINV